MCQFKLHRIRTQGARARAVLSPPVVIFFFFFAVVVFSLLCSFHDGVLVFALLYQLYLRRSWGRGKTFYTINTTTVVLKPSNVSMVQRQHRPSPQNISEIFGQKHAFAIYIQKNEKCTSAVRWTENNFDLNSALQVACDASFARVTGCVYPRERYRSVTPLLMPGSTGLRRSTLSCAPKLCIPHLLYE